MRVENRGIGIKGVKFRVEVVKKTGFRVENLRVEAVKKTGFRVES